MKGAIVTGSDLGKSFRQGATAVQALRAVSFALVPGELVALVGPSGSGKSTLLGLLCGWEAADAGRLDWSGRLDAADAATIPWSRLAIIPQASGLIEDLSLAENVALPVRLGAPAGTRSPDPDAKARVADLMARFGIGHLADRLPHECSLGEQQRAAVARALVLRPDLILADEPSAHQDAGFARVILTALRDAAHEGATCLVATHNPEGLRYADRVLRLSDGMLTAG